VATLSADVTIGLRTVTRALTSAECHERSGG
jgi:hypothetical protein